MSAARKVGYGIFLGLILVGMESPTRADSFEAEVRHLTACLQSVSTAQATAYSAYRPEIVNGSGMRIVPGNNALLRFRGSTILERITPDGIRRFKLEAGFLDNVVLKTARGQEDDFLFLDVDGLKVAPAVLAKDRGCGAPSPKNLDSNYSIKESSYRANLTREDLAPYYDDLAGWFERNVEGTKAAGRGPVYAAFKPCEAIQDAEFKKRYDAVLAKRPQVKEGVGRPQRRAEVPSAPSDSTSAEVPNGDSSQNGASE